MESSGEVLAVPGKVMTGINEGREASSGESLEALHSGSRGICYEGAELGLVRVLLYHLPKHRHLVLVRQCISVLEGGIVVCKIIPQSIYQQYYSLFEWWCHPAASPSVWQTACLSLEVWLCISEVITAGV